MFDLDQDYPRDMVGYGRHRPDPRWPENKRVAVQFVVNYEEGGENCVLHGDAASEAFLSEIVGALPWPGRRHANMESLYEYGARAGFWRLWRAFTRRNLPVTVFGVASAMQRNTEAVSAMVEAGWEIASHGLRWIDYRDHSPEAERADLDAAVALQTALTGNRPLGLYQGRTSANTVALAAAEGGFLYLADSYADDLPYWILTGGRQQLVVPYTLDANDMRFATPQGFNSGDQFFAYLKDTFDVLYREGGMRHGGIMSVGLHCRLVGRPGRTAALERFLDYVGDHPDAWVTTRLDIARHWIAAHPPHGGYRPSRMGRALFREVFGALCADLSGRSIDEGAAMAERVYADGLGPQADTHPDLARRFAEATRTSADNPRLRDRLDARLGRSPRPAV
ncbi:allantoinase PuuE [Methylobacterium sp. J-070]|uniref:allantoinase PuuE n=1 Tax=Methylobacterium sp. J-070 TaxID=2836650 RepID=UPI001FBA0B4F|nr:allantoinase PuuE [Methylobacterium sp. J-070]MCJ2053568.1 allantoinase PuuE [Methylobacterium sp. J-070]